MEYKLLEEQDLELMLDFVDDENTKYNVDVLKKFIDNKCYEKAGGINDADDEVVYVYDFREEN